MANVIISGRQPLRLITRAVIVRKIDYCLYCNISASRNFFGGSEVNQGRACKGGLPRGGSRGGAPGRRSFQKICKKSMKILQFFENYKGNFAIFSQFLKSLSNFWRKFVLNIRNFRNMYL